MFFGIQLDKKGQCFKTGCFGAHSFKKNALCDVKALCEHLNHYRG